MTTDEALQDDDDVANNLIAAGAVLAMLWSSQDSTRGRRGLQDVRLVADAEGSPTNQIDIDLSFMASPYRITVERVPDA